LTTASPLIDRRNIDFLLHDVLGIDALSRLSRFSAHSGETFAAAIDLAHRLAVEKFLPHNRMADIQEPELIGDRVRVIDETKAALDAYVGAGFIAASADETQGGMQLPYAISLLCDGMFMGANAGSSGYALLSKAAANLLAAHGCDEQKQRYMLPMLAGRYFGTMCLSEPQAGSSLADIKTRAELHDDGHYRLTGAKMWISGGDHELTENIVHLVLARIAGAPAGVKGISLFIVPKFLVNDDGSRGLRNDVRTAGVNHKMGQRGIVNTFLKFGEADSCIGELVGEKHCGIVYMFHMMNEARLGVSMSAIMLGYAGYLYCLDYARERRQGRHPDQKDANSPPVALIEHADVRRMLLQQRSYVEGAFALALQTAMLVDIAAHEADTDKRRDALLLLDLLTPIVKSWSSEWSIKSNDLAIQVLGGYGYSREYPLEQLYRDNRLNAIHEGANAIQAIDLLGRKAMQHDGAGLRTLTSHIERSGLAALDIPALREDGLRLVAYAQEIAQITSSLSHTMTAGQTRLALANAQHYMNLLGHVAIAWMWLDQARVAFRLLAEGDAQADFLRGKIHTANFFFRHELPIVEHSANLLRTLDGTTYDMQAAWF
jgi:alkylation response protein AidB-like acyl-CoA dehydrogenase